MKAKDSLEDNTSRAAPELDALDEVIQVRTKVLADTVNRREQPAERLGVGIRAEDDAGRVGSPLCRVYSLAQRLYLMLS